MKRLRRIIVRIGSLSFLIFLFITLNASPGLAQQTQEKLTQTSLARRDAAAVMLSVTVTDRQRNYVKGLTQANFTISDGKQEQQIVAFSDSDMPLSVGILLDTSSSVNTKSLRPVKAALSRFFQMSNKANEYFLISFETQPRLLQDWTSDTDSILKHFGSISAKGATAMFDACYSAVEKIERGPHRKRALILISDGQDSVSSLTLSKLTRLLEESDVLIYSIGITGDVDPGSSYAAEGHPNLEKLASVTGGDFFLPTDAKQIDSAFDTIAVELRNQYLVGFTPTANDRKRHSLKIRVTPPLNAPREMKNLNVRSRKNFYAKLSQP